MHPYSRASVASALNSRTLSENKEEQQLLLLIIIQCVCVCVCVFIKLHITAQSGLVILAIICHSH